MVDQKRWRTVMYVKVGKDGVTCDGSAGQWAPASTVYYGYCTPYVDQFPAPHVRISFEHFIHV
jgi:hypothetical protein